VRIALVAQDTTEFKIALRSSRERIEREIGRGGELLVREVLGQDTAADEHGKLRVHLRERGKSIGDFDDRGARAESRHPRRGGVYLCL
jgi:hypothetical protein